MTTITLKQEEAKTIRFTETDSDGTAVSLSTSTLRFNVKRSKREAASVIAKVDADFDKISAALGIVTVPLSATDLDLDFGEYVGELMIMFSASNIDKSADISIEIQRAVIG